MLPDRIKTIKEIESDQDINEIIAQIKTEPLTPQKQTTDKHLHYAEMTKNVTPSPMLSYIEKCQMTNSLSSSKSGRSNMTMLLQQQAMSRSCQVVVYFFPFHANPGSPIVPKQNVIAFDFLELKQNSTVWNHKPQQWQFLFEYDRDQPEEAGGQYIDKFFHNFKACPQRDSHLNNDIKQRTTRNGKIVQSWLLYKMVDVTMTSEMVVAELQKLALMAGDIEIQDRYHALIEALGFTGDLVDQTIKETGTYWNKLRNAVKTNIKTVSQNSLINIFRDDEIKEILQKMFEVRPVPHLWPEHIQQYAINNTL